MKNILKNILAGACVMVLSASCDMDLYPTSAIPYDENKPIFNTMADVEQFQRGVLASYRAVQYGTFTQSSEVMCDGFNATVGFGNNYGAIHRTDETFTASDDNVESFWGSHYAAIKNYNIVIAGASKGVPKELEQSVELLKGIALYCRASSYLSLARHFGNAYDKETAEADLCVPLVLRYNLFEKPARATVYEVYSQISSDLLRAEEILQYVAGEIRAQVPTIDAVRAMLARCFLDMGEYDIAIDYAKEVIGSDAGYELSDSERMMTAEFSTDNGNEPILQLYADPSEGKVYNTLFTLVGNDNEGRYFGSYYLPSQKLLSAYESTDLRYKTWFTSTQYPIFMQGDRHYGTTVFVKYIGNPNLLIGAVETGAHCAKPIMISEMYLIAAEAYAMNGRPDKATGFLNVLQEARMATKTTGDMENIKKEWFRETVGEGHRLACLKRWGDGFDGRASQTIAEEIIMTSPSTVAKDPYAGKKIDPNSKDSYYVMNWPIPAYEIKLNKNLDQNYGYER